MKITITTRNFSLTDTLQKYVDKKISKLERFSHLIIDGSLVLEKDKGINITEMNLAIKHSSITSRVKNNDLYLGINELFKKIERQLDKYEEKLKERKRLARKTKRK